MKKIIGYGIAPLGLALLTATGILLVPACKKECKTSSCFDRKTMLNDIGTKAILPSFAQFAQQTALLRQEAASFVNAPDAAGLVSLQNRWKESAYALKKVELFKNGPVNTGMFYPAIDFWPVRTNDVETYFNATGTFTSAGLTAKGSTVKGSPVIEYLIFDPVNGNTAVLDRFTVHADAAKRKAYLVALCENLDGIAQQLDDQWKNGYFSTFVANDGTSITSSANSLVNEILALEDYAKGMKVGYPSGKKDGNLYPQNVEAYASGQSIAFVKKNLDVLEAVFTGADGQGLDDYLDFVGAEDGGVRLSEKIRSQFTVCQNKCDAVNLPLSQAVSQQPQAVTELYNELQKLLVYLKVDMVNNLGITITLNDNDGD